MLAYFDSLHFAQSTIYLDASLQVEAALMTSNYVDNIMVYADPFHNYCVALVVPIHQVLEKWAKEGGIKYTDFPDLCDKAEAVKEVQQSLLKVCFFPFDS